MDPFAGNNVDPQSLHKYLYANGNPINLIDPNGELPISVVVLAILSMFGLLFLGGCSKSDKGAVMGICGPDITAQLTGLRSEIASHFDSSGFWHRVGICTGVYGTNSWDILELKSTIGRTEGVCQQTVSVAGKCYLADEVNYFLWGAVASQCSRFGLVPKLTVAVYTPFSSLGEERAACKRAWVGAGFSGDVTDVKCGIKRECRQRGPKEADWDELRCITAQIKPGVPLISSFRKSWDKRNVDIKSCRK